MVEPLLSLVIKFLGGKLGIKLLLIVGAFAVSIIKFISDFMNPAEKKLVDSTTNRTEDITINDAVSVRDAVDARSEEHTSELQSLRHLVCRLLLEKKKIQ